MDGDAVDIGLLGELIDGAGPEAEAREIDLSVGIFDADFVELRE